MPRQYVNKQASGTMFQTQAVKEPIEAIAERVMAIAKRLVVAENTILQQRETIGNLNSKVEKLENKIENIALKASGKEFKKPEARAPRRKSAAKADEITITTEEETK